MKKRASLTIDKDLYLDIRDFVNTCKKYSTVTSFITQAVFEKLQEEKDFVEDNIEF